MTQRESISWDAYNNLQIYGELGRFTKLLARYELFKLIVDLPGDIVEGGVFKGAGLFYWAKLTAIYNPHTNRKVVGFDTFEGYPRSDVANEAEVADEFERRTAYQAPSVEELTRIAASQNLEGRIELVKGNVTSTVREYVKANPGFRIALLNLDFDGYDATKAALDSLFHVVVRGGVVVLDEYAMGQWGESDAADEFMQQHDIQLKSLPWTHTPSAYFKKGK